MTLEIKEYNYEISPIEDVKKIMNSCHWWTVTDNEFEILLKSSAAVFISYQDNEPVGMARVLSDNVIYSLIIDVLVIPNYRGKGIGTKLIERIFDYTKRANLKIIKLFSTPEGKTLYEKFGFKVRTPDSTGMIKFIE